MVQGLWGRLVHELLSAFLVDSTVAISFSKVE